MANYKRFVTGYLTGATVYVMVIRDTDGYYLATDKGSFASGAGYPAMSEHATVKGLYALNTNDAEWDDGAYTVAAYVQAGASPAPASDTLISCGTLRILDDTEVDMIAALVSILEDTNELQGNQGAWATVGADAIRSAVGMAAADLDAQFDVLPTAAEAAAAVLAAAVEGSVTLEQLLRALLSEACGKSSGGRTTTITFRDQADTKDRITGTMDGDGNRVAVTLDLT